MSSHPPSNENLSAYFDQEASPEERQEIESLLEKSTEARQELHEIRELSRLLQETATESAPPELAASIRRRIEQETLLTATAPAAVKRGPSLMRYRIAVAISTCSSLAALILFVLLMNTPESAFEFQTRSVDRLASHPATQPAIESALVLSNNIPEVRSVANLSDSEKPEMQGVKVMPAPSVAFTPSADKFDMNEELAKNESLIKKFKGDFSIKNTVAEKKLAENYPGSAIPDHIPLDSIRIGDALPYFSNIDGKVAVIEVHVVDVKRALGTMEVLLARNNIPVNLKKQSAVERKVGRSHNLKATDTLAGKSTLVAPDEAANQLFAVYVEATDAQLAAALKDFQKDLQRDQLVGLALQPAINASSLTEELAELPQLLAQRSTRSDTKKEASAVAGVPVRSLKKKPFADRSSTIDSKRKKASVSAAFTKKRQVAKDEQSSYQMRYRMQIPAEQMNRRAISGQSMKRQAMNEVKQKAGKKILPAQLPALVASKPDGAITNKSPGKKAGQNQPAAPVKVLFVFKDAANLTTLPAPQ